ncbi:serine/threonine-protein kinase [Raineya orbicola]|jgi:serine/threonine protein kinase|uniref:Protein kinase domain n=1 Tax=Raineya orbicola TaxID=2016530 RepID=A0A2N3IIN1_9BACT|nr:serine/threonine-protein kinase [Raineya orbicola]PKQ70131.1 Protein kinase domain [Raineya orbicola]
MKGRVVGKYVIDELIGEGGMGAVYKAHHQSIDRKAAVKVLSPQFSKNPHLKERFKNEAATMARLNHSGIVTLYDYVEEGDEAFLIMEFAEGLPLDTIIEKNGKLPEPLAQELLIQMAEALAYAHSQGVIHRDIKPSNFIISPENRVKVLDFGIAKMLDETSRHLTKTGMRMGSIYFMSPEQVRGDKDITHRTDIYSLGLTYYVMLIGEYPLAHHTSEYAIYDEIVNKDFIDFNKLKGKISDKSIELIRKCLQRNPQERFATALEIVKFLKEKETPINKPIEVQPKIEPKPIPQEKPDVKIQEQPKTFQHPSVVSAPPPKKSRAWKWILGILLASFLAYFFIPEVRYFVTYELWHLLGKKESYSQNTDNTSEEAGGYKMYVTATSLNLRDYPQTGNVLTVIPYASEVYVINEITTDSNWVEIRYKNYRGYVFKHYIADHPRPVYKVIASQAYFYQEPTLDYPTNAYVIAGQFVLAEEERNGFIYTNFHYGGKVTSGWLYKYDLERVK